VYYSITLLFVNGSRYITTRYCTVYKFISDTRFLSLYFNIQLFNMIYSITLSLVFSTYACLSACLPQRLRESLSESVGLIRDKQSALDQLHEAALTRMRKSGERKREQRSVSQEDILFDLREVTLCNLHLNIRDHTVMYLTIFNSLIICKY